MTRIRLNDPCILFALRRESAPFRRAFRPRQLFPGAPCWAWFCGPPENSVLVVETGIGQVNVVRVLDWLLTKPTFEDLPYEPKWMTFAGFAGALTDELHVGDIVQADEVVDEHGHAWRTSFASALKRGRLLTVDRIIASPAEKRQLGQRYRADLVDMESAHFAARCTQANIPFACIRAISDEAATSLSPALTSMVSGGVASPWRVLRTLALRPAMLPELLRLARDTNHAAKELGRALVELLASKANSP